MCIFCRRLRHYISINSNIARRRLNLNLIRPRYVDIIMYKHVVASWYDHIPVLFFLARIFPSNASDKRLLPENLLVLPKYYRLKNLREMQPPCSSAPRLIRLRLSTSAGNPKAREVSTFMQKPQVILYNIHWASKETYNYLEWWPLKSTASKWMIFGLMLAKLVGGNVSWSNIRGVAGATGYNITSSIMTWRHSHRCRFVFDSLPPPPPPRSNQNRIQTSFSREWMQCIILLNISIKNSNDNYHVTSILDIVCG